MAPTEENEWNPMSEAYHDPKFNAYTEGPGADMDDNLQPGNLSRQKNNQGFNRVQIHVTNLPKGINEIGVCNLFLSVGKPVSIYLHPTGSFAKVEFCKPSQAELAIRDLDGQEPFNLRVSYARSRDNESRRERYEDVDPNHKEWVFDSPVVDTRPKIERGEIIKHGEKILFDVCPKEKPLPTFLDYKNDPRYYQFIKDDFDMSVAFYQMNADYNGSSDCVSKGRGYYYMGSKDRFVGNGKMLSSGSKVWKNKFLKIHECYHCQAKTIKMCNYCRVPFCSNPCIAANSHDCSKERLLTEKSGLPEKGKWEYMIPQSLYYREQKINLGTSVVESLNSDSSGFIKLSYGSSSVCYGTLTPKGKSNEYSNIAALQTPKENIEGATEGDQVLVPDDCRVGRRGVILSIGDIFYRVALVDTAEVVTVEKVYPIGDDISEIENFGVQLTITEEISENFLETLPGRGGRFYFEATGPTKSGRCPIVLKNMLTKRMIGKGFLTKWTPLLDLECVELKSNSLVVMSSYISAKVMYVRPDDKERREKFSLLNNEVAHCALRTESLKQTPIVGDMYCARYNMDGCFYRAVVKSIEKEKIKIVFIDFGNEEYVTKQDLKQLPDSLKRVPCFAVKVYLKDVPKKSSAQAIYYLNTLTSGSAELLLTFYDSILNGVELRSKATGIHVNTQLIDDLTPLWKKDPNYQSKTSEVVFKKRLHSLRFPGEEKQQSYFLCVDSENFSSSGMFWVVPNIPQYISYIYGEFKDKIEEYCESFDDDYCYLPRENELCFGLYEGEWLRAACVHQEGTSCYLVFVDYGYRTIVETNAIRKLRKEFIEAASLAVPCVISGHERWKDKPELEKKVVDHLNKFSKMEIAKLTMDSGVYNVSLSFVERLLG